MESEDVWIRPVGNASVETKPGCGFRFRDVDGPSEFAEPTWERFRVEQIFRLADVEWCFFVMPVPIFGNQFAHLFRAKGETAVAGPIPENAS